MLTQTTKRFALRTFSTSRVAFATPQLAGNDGFKDRERAQEAAYIKKHEAEQLAKLREELEKQKAQIEQLKEKIDGKN